MAPNAPLALGGGCQGALQPAGLREAHRGAFQH